MKTKISLPVVISLIMSFIILSTSFTGVMAVNKTTTATIQEPRQAQEYSWEQTRTQKLETKTARHA